MFTKPKGMAVPSVGKQSPRLEPFQYVPPKPAPTPSAAELLKQINAESKLIRPSPPRAFSPNPPSRPASPGLFGHAVPKASPRQGVEPASAKSAQTSEGKSSLLKIKYVPTTRWVVIITACFLLALLAHVSTLSETNARSGQAQEQKKELDEQKVRLNQLAEKVARGEKKISRDLIEVKSFINNPPTELSQANLAFEQQRYQDAAQLYEHYLRLDPNSRVQDLVLLKAAAAYGAYGACSMVDKQVRILKQLNPKGEQYQKANQISIKCRAARKRVE